MKYENSRISTREKRQLGWGTRGATRTRRAGSLNVSTTVQRAITSGNGAASLQMRSLEAPFAEVPSDPPPSGPSHTRPPLCAEVATGDQTVPHMSPSPPWDLSGCPHGVVGPHGLDSGFSAALREPSRQARNETRVVCPIHLFSYLGRKISASDSIVRSYVLPPTVFSLKKKSFLFFKKNNNL